MKATNLWKYSHLSLAILSSVFILLLTITGAILALEPFFDSSQSTTIDAEESVAKFLKRQPKNTEVFALKLDQNSIVVNWQNAEQQNEKVYLDTNWNSLGKVSSKPSFFKWVTNFHRSLLLKKTGRYLVGIASFFLILICVSGIVLVRNRQGGFRQFFKQIIEENKFQFRHILYGRNLVILVLLIAVSGLFLSLEKLHFIKVEKPKTVSSTLANWTQIPLHEVTQINYPFSADSTDYFEVHTQGERYHVDQYSGVIVSSATTDWKKQLLDWSFSIHTGTDSLVWAGFLLVGCCYLGYLIFSGLNITFQQKKHRISNIYSPSDAKIVILVGTQTSHTLAFANHLKNELLNNDQKVHLNYLNSYKNQYSNMEKLLVLASTYGDGEPPKTATQFMAKFGQNPISKSFQYSVLGTGSKAYANYCSFAVEVDQLLGATAEGKAILPLEKIHQQSTQNINQWATALFEKENWRYTPYQMLSIPRKYQQLKVLSNTEATAENNRIFDLELKPHWNWKTKRGDLLAILGEDGMERYYSVGITSNKRIALSIKKHSQGLVSTHLSNLKTGDFLKARWVQNFHFHFPKNKPIIGIANGTGIAPFLHHSPTRQPFHLYWGTRFKKVYTERKSALQGASIRVALSQEVDHPKRYVQELLNQDQSQLIELLKQDAVVMICGSVAMEKSVISFFDELLSSHSLPSVEALKNTKRWLSDCY